jgi:hypothetical protein
MATQSDNRNRQPGENDQGGGEQKRADQGGSSDLKEREYRDGEGNVHHHTKKFMEEKGK